MVKLTRNKRTTKAVSPVLAALMTIAIAITVSLIAFSWIMGYLGGTTQKTEKAIFIQGTAINTIENSLTIYIQNTGKGTVIIDSIYINDYLIKNKLDIQLTEGKTATIPINHPITSNQQLTIKITTTEGTSTQTTITIP